MLCDAQTIFILDLVLIQLIIQFNYRLYNEAKLKANGLF